MTTIEDCDIVRPCKRTTSHLKLQLTHHNGHLKEEAFRRPLTSLIAAVSSFLLATKISLEPVGGVSVSRGRCPKWRVWLSYFPGSSNNLLHLTNESLLDLRSQNPVCAVELLSLVVLTAVSIQTPTPWTSYSKLATDTLLIASGRLFSQQRPRSSTIPQARFRV